MMASASTIKRKCFSIEEKGAIVARLENGESNVSLASEFGVSHSTISTMWKNREKIREAFNNNALKAKKLRSSLHDDLDKCLLQWFKNQRSKNVPITGPILREKANEFGQLLGKQNYHCSEGWINRFRSRHNIVFGKISGEAASVPDGVPETWLQTVFQEIRKGYTDDEIFNADETGLFYRMTYDKTMKFKGERCTGGKMSKERITVMVAANMTGSEKRKLFVIGKAKRPRCFRNVKSLPVVYEHNKKAWMTSELFTKFLREWDSELQRSSKKILLVVDNCPAHPNVENLKAIKLCFLPPNCTSVLQPMDQGVINSLKMQYRKMQILENIRNIELNKERGITLLDAVLMVSTAWEKVSSKTIESCFRHAGFTKAVNEEAIDIDSDFDEEDNMPLAQLINSVTATVLTDDELLEFVNIDQDLETWGDLNEAEIVKNLEKDTVVTEITEENDDEEGADLQVPSCAEALQAVSTLRRFATFEGLKDKEVLESISTLEKRLERTYYNTKCNKQSKITDFFST